MAAKRSERSRWVTVFRLHCPVESAEGTKVAREQHGQLAAVVQAFADVGRVVRLEPTKYGATLVLKARRA